MRRLEGQVAVVTGASSGIGEAIARRFSEEGAKVALVARREARLEAIAQDLGHGAKAFVTDVTNESNVKKTLDEVLARAGRIDILVNNAGLGKMVPLTDGDTEDWRQILETNLLAPMVMTRELLSRQKSPHILFTSSMSAHRLTTGGGMYAASKTGLRILVESLRRQLRRDGCLAKLTLLSPGWVETEFAEVSLGDKDKARAHWDRVSALEPKAIADAALFAVTAQASCEVNDILLRHHQQAE